MPINTNVSNLPSAPNRSGSPNTFTSDTDAFLAALPTLQSEINAYAAAANSTGDQISEYLSAAEQGAVTGLDVARWDSEITYARFDPVIGSDGNTYRSLVDNNLGNEPTTDGGDNWLNLSEVSLAPILKPELLSPTDGATDIGETPTLDAGNYYSLYGRPHTLSRFQVATDQAFTSIVYDSGEIAATQTHTVPAGNLQEGQVTYYWRAYYEDDAGNQSEFSDPFEFVTADSFFTPVEATGGTVTDITDGGVNYRVHTFTSSGTFDVTGAGQVEYLVVAGGGGAGSMNGGSASGGGGAGGYRSSVQGEFSGGGSSAESLLNLTSGSYSIVVGAGGAGGALVADPGENGDQGSDSSFGSITSIGGGYGSSFTRITGPGGAGGSGGGAGGRDDGAGGSGTAGQGFDGGNSADSTNSADDGAGGGGGAAEAGTRGTPIGGGDGGDGVQSNIDGTGTYRAGGGGGAGEDPGDGHGSGGLGGGGDAPDGDNAITNSGGGGGGVDSSDGAGGNGGSGIVIIRYEI